MFTVSRVALLISIGLFLFAVGHGMDSLRKENTSGRLAITPIKLDFGDVPSGSRVVRPVVLQNTGSGRLLIVSVKTSCQCFAPQIPTRKLEPGQSETVLVTFPQKGTGSKTHQILFETDDPAESHLILTLTGNLVAAE